LVALYDTGLKMHLAYYYSAGAHTEHTEPIEDN